MLRCSGNAQRRGVIRGPQLHAGDAVRVTVIRGPDHARHLSPADVKRKDSGRDEVGLLHEAEDVDGCPRGRARERIDPRREVQADTWS
jgi:hypothetical protein